MGRKEEEREEQEGSGRRRSKGTALGRWTAYARMGAWRSPDMQRWLQLILMLFAHFYKSGDPQAEERFKLNAKVGKKKTRGAKVFMMVIDKYLFETLGLQRRCRVHKDYMITPLNG